MYGILLATSITTALATTCPLLNQDVSNPGRCGPLFGGKRCNKNLIDYAVYCNSDHGWCGNTDEHKNAQTDDQYDFEPMSCTPNTCSRALNSDVSNPGRCGPLFGNKRCNRNLISYAVYCNSDHGWCGNTDAHKNAQADDQYDFVPASCDTTESTCPALNQDANNPGRCGPLFGGVRCNKNLVDYAVYCNSDHGWCGNTDEHKNAQADDQYDWQPLLSCVVPLGFAAQEANEHSMLDDMVKSVYSTQDSGNASGGAGYLFYALFVMVALNLVISCLHFSCWQKRSGMASNGAVKFDKINDDDDEI